MKTLTLLRHAKSGDDGLVARDLDRHLNEKGRRAARAIGRYLRDEAISFDAALASPATRVQETLAEVGEGYGTPLSPENERGIYLATADELLDIVRRAPAAADRLLLAGHNPGLEELVLMLVPGSGSDAARDQVEEKYPTASLSEIAFDVDRWEAVAAGCGRLVRFVRPRDLDPELGPDTP